MVNTPKLPIKLFVLVLIMAIAVLNELNGNAHAEDISFSNMRAHTPRERETRIAIILIPN